MLNVWSSSSFHPVARGLTRGARGARDGGDGGGVVPVVLVAVAPGHARAERERGESCQRGIGP